MDGQTNTDSFTQQNSLLQTELVSGPWVKIVLSSYCKVKNEVNCANTSDCS